MNTAGPPFIPNPNFPTSTPNPGAQEPNDQIKSAGPPKPVASGPAPAAPAQGSPMPSTLPVAPRAPQMPVQQSGDVGHLPNQVRPGLHAPIPVSRTPWERPSSLDALLFNVSRLKRNSRSWYNDGEWPDLEAQLQMWLWILFEDYKRSGMQPALWYDIDLVRFFLHLHPLPRDLMVWNGPEVTTAETEST
jgi:hypothetical protein